METSHNTPDSPADTLYSDAPQDAPQDTEPAERVPAPPVIEQTPGPTYTAEEVAQHTALLTARERLQQADAAFVQRYGSADLTVLERQIAELAKTDKARAVQLQSDIKDYLRGRQHFVQQLVTADQELKQRVASRQHNHVRQSEREKLLAAAPELENPAVAQQFHSWLLKEGYTREQIAATTDHRLYVHMHKLWRSQQPAQASAPVVKLRVRKPQPADQLESPGHRLAREFYRLPVRKQSSARPDPRVEDPVSILYPERRR